MFDTTAEFEVPVPGLKPRTVTLSNFPSDEDQMNRLRAQRIRVKLRGEPEISDSGDFDAALIQELRKDEGDPLEPEEASAILDWIFEAEAEDDPEVSGDEVVVRLGLPNGETGVHTLRIPTYPVLTKWFGRRRKMTGKGQRGAIVTIEIGESGRIYDEHVVMSEGCGEAVPLVHKDAVLLTLYEFMQVPYGERSKN